MHQTLALWHWKEQLSSTSCLMFFSPANQVPHMARTCRTVLENRAATAGCFCLQRVKSPVLSVGFTHTSSQLPLYLSCLTTVVLPAFYCMNPRQLGDREPPPPWAARSLRRGLALTIRTSHGVLSSKQPL